MSFWATAWFSWWPLVKTRTFSSMPSRASWGLMNSRISACGTASAPIETVCGADWASAPGVASARGARAVRAMNQRRVEEEGVVIGRAFVIEEGAEGQWLSGVSGGGGIRGDAVRSQNIRVVAQGHVGV